MAQSITQYEISHRYIDYDVWGPVSFIVVKLLNYDPEASDKNFILSNDMATSILIYNNLESTPASIGGPITDFNASTFSGYTYPIERTNENTRLTITQEGDSRFGSLRVKLDVTTDDPGVQRWSYNVIANRNHNRFKPYIIYTTADDYMIPIISSCFPNCSIAPNTNTYLAATDKAGLPIIYGVNSGFEDTLPLTVTVSGGFVVKIDEISFAPTPESEDPYSGAGDSEPVAFPHGDFDYGSDPIGGADRFHIPSVSVVDTGFVTLYNPTIQELKALSSYLWSSTFDLDTFKKIFNDPMDLFIGLSMIPVRVPQGPSKEVGIGMIGSGVYMTTASAQVVLVNCGTCDVPNFSGGYLDYSPYTKVEVYLPYIGFRTLNADEVMGKTLWVHYKVDILSGACTCWIDVLTTIADGTTDWCTTYVFMGECAVSIPLASGDWTNLLNGIIGAAAAVGAGFAAGGAGGAIAGGVSAASSVGVNDSKIHVERSGAITSSAGLMAPQSPYLIISTPHIHKPAEVPYYTGYPAYFTASLGDLSGFTIIDNIHLSNIPATEPELEEIETLLKGGVIL